MPTPNHEPDEITAGETVSWTKVFALFPASAGNTLKYSFQAPGKELITIAAAANGDAYAIGLTQEITGAYSPGVYTWTSYIEGPGGRTGFHRGTISILPSPLAAFAPTHASRMLFLIDAALEGRIPNGLEETDIDGQRINRILVVDLRRLRDRYKSMVIAEDAARDSLMGIRRRRRALTIRFTKPGTGFPGRVPHSQ